MPEAVTRTTCPYCGVGCGVLASRAGDGWSVRGDPEHPANFGRLCSKGAALADTLGLDERLLHPEIGGRRVSWDVAIDTVAERFRRTLAEHGPESVAFYVSGQLLTEDYYVANKLMKGYLGSGNIDTNSRLCMSSAVAGHKRAFGADVVPGCYQDPEQADLVVLAGSNAAWTHPVLFQRLVAARRARPEMRVVIIDPRRTATRELAQEPDDLHLALRPGSDIWLWNGLLEYLKRADALDWRYLEAHVEGFGETLAAVAGLDIPETARRCGLEEAGVAAFFRMFATTPKTVTLFSQGINQSASGTDQVNAILNAHLATGRIGKPGATPFSITGQPNAMGGREVGGLANQLAAHMDFTDPDIDRVGRFWNAPNMARRPGLKAVELFQAVRDGRVKALWIMATNPALSLPDADAVTAALRACPFVVVSEVTAHTDTARHAHVLLPAAAWGEKDGTVTNSERRVSRQRAFLPLPGEARPDWRIIADVARRMGHAGFEYAGVADIFAEHAALSGFENDGARAFDLAALAHAAYDTLPPTRWPARAGADNARLFADGRFSTASGKARMLPIRPRAPVHVADAGYPWLLNTGRVRDQWHGMTRTGKSARLLAHIAEPCLDIHPDDARRVGLRDGDLARVGNARGELLLRVAENPGQRVGDVFAPIHWNDQFSARARVDALVAAETDPISGQPEFKRTPVAVAPYAAGWHGFVMARSALDGLPGEYWTRIRAGACWRHELAGMETELDAAARLRARLGAGGDWLEMADVGAGRHRGALIENDRLIALYFLERDAAALPPRHWLETLFARATLDEAERRALLLGRPAEAAPDHGRVVCACFGVGEASLIEAITAGARSLEALGQRLKAGGNCGSCIPELKRLLRQHP